MQVREEGIDRLLGATVWPEIWYNMHLVYGNVKSRRWQFRNYVCQLVVTNLSSRWQEKINATSFFFSLLSSLYYFFSLHFPVLFPISIFLYSFRSVVGNQSVMHIICRRLGPIRDAIISDIITWTEIIISPYILISTFLLRCRQFPFTPLNFTFLHFQYIKHKREFPVHPGYYSIPFPFFKGFIFKCNIWNQI